MNVFMPVEKNEEILDGLFDFNGRMVYSSLALAMQGMDKSDCYIMEAQLLDEKEIQECVCQSLIGNRYSKLQVRWVATYTKKLFDAA